ncbi:tetratricopeptide repeat protein [Acidithiobacillus sp.]|uniref:tetratricopeptide repeat protein n=1 Tax=Acidithiobacillus sp. TaxID=1872118 RepID=UPI003D05E0A6
MRSLTYHARFFLIAGCLLWMYGLSTAYGDPASAIRLGRLAMAQNHPFAALSCFRAANAEIDANPSAYPADRLSALSGLGYSSLWVGKAHEAERAYRQGLLLAHSAADRKTMRIGLARALIDLGRPREARRLLQPVHKVSHEAALQSAIAANLLDWNTLASASLQEAAPIGHYAGPLWLQRLYGETKDYVDFTLKSQVNIGYHYSSDSDHNINQIYDAGVTIPGRGLGDNALNPTMWHVGYRQIQINDSDGQVGISALSGGWGASLDRNWQYMVRGGVGTARNWTFGQGEGQITYQPDDTWGLAVSVDRAPIRTFEAVQNHILANTISAGGFGRLRNVGTLAASYFHQAFSDGNQRNGVVARVTPEFYSFDSIPVSLGVQGYFRDYSSGYVPFDGYFNPRHYSEALGYVIYVQKFSPFWIMRLYAGFGSQTVDMTTTPVKDIFGTITGLVSPYMQVSLTGGYTQVASAYGGGAGYHRSYVQANISIPF